MNASPEQVIPLYERYAQQWDQDRPRQLKEKTWLDQFVSALSDGAQILDLGCGAGDPMAKYLLETGQMVTGIDSSPSLIALCEARFPDANWMVADMRQLALDKKFAGLLAWNSFFHLSQDDQRQMFEVFRQHAAPDAVLMFTSGTVDGEAIGRLRDQPLYHASLDTKEYRSLLDSYGFEVIQHVVADPHCYDLTVWLTRSRGTQTD